MFESLEGQEIDTLEAVIFVMGFAARQLGPKVFFIFILRMKFNRHIIRPDHI